MEALDYCYEALGQAAEVAGQVTHHDLRQLSIAIDCLRSMRVRIDAQINMTAGLVAERQVHLMQSLNTAQPSQPRTAAACI